MVSSACRQDPKRAVVGVTQTLILLGLDWFHIQRNNTKFLIDRDGKVLARFEPNITPDSAGITSAIEKALK